jgi:SAM-dependent methyltransferase
MSPPIDTARVVDWFRRRRQAKVSAARAQELYFTFHPRTAFLKNLPLAASVADIGAGDGSLSVFRNWPAPERSDLKLHAYSLEKGRLFDDFVSYETGDWNLAPPGFGNIQFDAVVSGHFIEHIADPTSLAAWLQSRLKENGRAYIEWPSENSLELPRQAELAAAGVNLLISRFDDDSTHRELPDREKVRNSLLARGFEIEVEGVIRLPWIEDQLMASLRDSPDPFPRQAAFWLMTGWSQYIVARRLPSCTP